MKSEFKFILAFLLFSNAINAQFTFAGKYEFNATSNWEDVVKTSHNSNERFINQGYSAHIGYWIKMLKEYRWELIPELGYGRSSSTVRHAVLNQNFEYNWSRIDLTLNNHVYLLNMESDCNCPTFSKDGNALAKGVFVNLAPGLSYNTYKKVNAEESSTLKNSSLTYFLKLGFGFDIGFGDLLTVSPFFNYTLRPSSKWEGLDPSLASDIETNSNVSQKEFGIRANFRFDYVKGRRF